MEKKMIKRKIRGAITKSAIYESALQLFGEYGFDKVSVDSIVEKAGISKGAFYVHFNSKNSLAAELISEYANKSDLDYKAFVESFPADASACAILVSLIEIISDNITDTIGYGYMKSTYTILLDRTIDSDMMLGYSRKIYEIFRSVIDRGLQQGEFKANNSADLLAEHFVMAIRGLTYEWCIRYPDFDLKDKLLKHFELLLSGVRA